MEKQNKLSPPELIALLAILIILLYFPYKMISEHMQDNAANSYYHNGR